MQCSVMLKVQAVMSDAYQNGAMCEDCYKECGSTVRGGDYDVVESLLDTVYAEETITSTEDYINQVKKWQHRRSELGASFVILHCNLLGQEAQIVRQKFSLKRNTGIHIVYSEVRDGAAYGTNLEASSFRETWKTEIQQKAKTIREPTAVFAMRETRGSLDDLTMEDLLIMYVPTIFAEFYAHSLSALMNSLHTFTPFLDRKSSRVRAPAPACCLENAVTHAQRKRRSERDQALYDSANLVATQLYHGIASHFGSKLCRELEMRGSGIDLEQRIGLEDETVPFCNLYVARGGEVEHRRGLADGFEIVCWTCYGSPGGGEFVVPGLMYKFDTGQGSTVLFRPNRFYHATLPPENRDVVNEKFAVALIS